MLRMPNVACCSRFPRFAADARSSTRAAGGLRGERAQRALQELAQLWDLLDCACDHRQRASRPRRGPRLGLLHGTDLRGVQRRLGFRPRYRAGATTPAVSLRDAASRHGFRAPRRPVPRQHRAARRCHGDAASRCRSAGSTTRTRDALGAGARASPPWRRMCLRSRRQVVTVLFVVSVVGCSLVAPRTTMSTGLSTRRWPRLRIASHEWSAHRAARRDAVRERLHTAAGRRRRPSRPGALRPRAEHSRR